MTDELLREASNPTTAPDRLRSLVRGETAGPDAPPVPVAVREAAAANPNAPPDALLYAASYLTGAFCRNPAASLVLLEDPGFARRIGQKRAFLRCPEAPEALVTALAAFASDRALAEEARMHVRVAGEMPDGGWHDAVRDHWRAYAAGPGRPAEREACGELAALGLLPSWAFGDPKTPAGARARGLAADLRAAADPATPAAELDRLAAKLVEDDGALRYLRLALSLNPAVPEAERDAHARNCRYRSVAWSRALVERAMADRDGGTHAERVLAACRAVSCHPDGAHWVRAFEFPLGKFARLLHPTTGEAIRRRAARSLAWRERLGAALSLNLRHGRSAEAFAPLADDGNRLVRAAARARQRGETFCWEGE